MARLVNQGGCLSTQLSTGWAFLTLAAAAATTPRPTASEDAWVPASVPGTVATDLQSVALANPHRDLHALDHWYRLETTMPGGARLEFCGLATLAEIWLDGRLVASSANMFIPLTVPVPAGGAGRLEVCFRALRPALRRREPGRRARWRSRLTTEEGLRHYRTTLLGHMPGWSGDVPVIGPFRPIIMHQPLAGAPVVDQADLRTRLLPDGSGLISIRLEGTGWAGATGTLSAAGQETALTADGSAWVARLRIPNAPRWWPHTHGEPTTCPVQAHVAGCAIDLGRIGFRTIERRDPAEGFGLIVNGTSVFCRGAIWAGLDPSGRPADAAALASPLRLARQAGFNMLRVTGVTVYETPEFFELCDALGIMVWHDLMFARFDYPGTPDFLAGARAEARAFMTMAQAHPCLTVLCGGTEIAQTAAMAGCPPDAWRMPLLDEALAAEAAALCPEIPYITQSPLSDASDGSCGGLPFAASGTVAHYFGVGAYQRPLDDLSSAGVRFAAECLAFANLPAPASQREVEAKAPVGGRRLAVPRDLGSEWDFADVRDHYVQMLFGTAVANLRRQDSAAWMDHGRAAVALIMQQALCAWRTDGRCAGALVLMLHDLSPGAGWGIIANDGRPKSPWYALRSVCQPIQVLLRDLGQNGIVLHAINETGTARQVRLGLRGLSPDGTVEDLGSTVLELEPRASRPIAATTLMGRWRDLAHAWQFGAPAFAALGAALDDAETGARISDSTHFPLGPALPKSQPYLTACLDASASTVEISAQGFAQFVHIDDDTYVPEDNYFHLWPGEKRVVGLRAPPGHNAAPAGTVTALNGHAAAHYRMAA